MKRRMLNEKKITIKSGGEEIQMAALEQAGAMETDDREKLRTRGTKYRGVPIGCPLGNISKSRSFGQVDKKSLLGLKN